MQLSQDKPVVAIVGYGVASVNAAIALRTAGFDGAIRVFSDTETLPYSPILTSYYAGGEKAYEECFPWSAEQLDELNLDVHANCPVSELLPSEHTIVAGGQRFAYSKCLIATGATPTCVGFPGVEGDEGYHPLVLRSMDDAERLKAAIESPSCKRMLISGASMVALKTLEACLRKDVECTLVGMRPHVLDFNALPEAAERFERGLVAQGVHLRLGQTIQHVARKDSQLEVTFSNGESDLFDEISVSHGMRSNLGFVKEGTLTIDRALVVDDYMRTSDPDIYAAGDVAQATELVSGEKRVVGIWKGAAMQGVCAGRAMAAELAGEKPEAGDAYAGSLAMNTIAVNGTLFISAGTIELSQNRHTEINETDDMTIVRIFEKDSNSAENADRLVGFNLTCDNDEAGSRAYDMGAMLTLRIEQSCANRMR